MPGKTWLYVCVSLSKDLSKMYATVHTYPGRTSTHNYVIVEAERTDKVETGDDLIDLPSSTLTNKVCCSHGLLGHRPASTNSSLTMGRATSDSGRGSQ
jgi:hypothetical protein